MSLDLSRGYAPWNQGPDAQTEQYFGHADWHHHRQTLNPNEMADWAVANADKFGRGTDSQAYKDIMAARNSYNPSSSGGGGGGASFENTNSMEIVNNNPFEEQEEVVDTESYFNPSDDNSVIEEFINQNEGGGQNVFQSAVQDNRMENIGNNSTFGDNAQVGINNAIQNVNQSANYGLDLKKRSDARSRAKDWLALSAVAG